MSAADYDRLWSGTDLWVDGYGDLVARHFAPLPVRLNCPVSAIDGPARAFASRPGWDPRRGGGHRHRPGGRAEQRRPRLFAGPAGRESGGPRWADDGRLHEGRHAPRPCEDRPEGCRRRGIGFVEGPTIYFEMARSAGRSPSRIWAATWPGTCVEPASPPQSHTRPNVLRPSSGRRRPVRSPAGIWPRGGRTPTPTGPIPSPSPATRMPAMACASRSASDCSLRARRSPGRGDDGRRRCPPSTESGPRGKSSSGFPRERGGYRSRRRAWTLNRASASVQTVSVRQPARAARSRKLSSVYL